MGQDKYSRGINDMDIDEVEQVVLSMPLAVKMDMANRAPEVFKALESYQINPSTYITNAEIVDAVVNGGYANTSELQK
mgnify:CR=1 FL=1